MVILAIDTVVQLRHKTVDPCGDKVLLSRVTKVLK